MRTRVLAGLAFRSFSLGETCCLFIQAKAPAFRIVFCAKAQSSTGPAHVDDDNSTVRHCAASREQPEALSGAYTLRH